MYATPQPSLATFDQAVAASCRAFAHSEHHRCPQLTHTNCSTESPVWTSIAVSTRRVPSHVLHRTNSVSIDERICRIEPDVWSNLHRGPRRKWCFALLLEHHCQAVAENVSPRRSSSILHNTVTTDKELLTTGYFYAFQGWETVKTAHFFPSASHVVAWENTPGFTIPPNPMDIPPEPRS
jgi:hypothetical protein